MHRISGEWKDGWIFSGLGECAHNYSRALLLFSSFLLVYSHIIVRTYKWTSLDRLHFQSLTFGLSLMINILILSFIIRYKCCRFLHRTHSNNIRVSQILYKEIVLTLNKVGNKLRNWFLYSMYQSQSRFVLYSISYFLHPLLPFSLLCVWCGCRVDKRLSFLLCGLRTAVNWIH